MGDFFESERNEVVCWCRGVTKGDILCAIREGARTVEEVSNKTGAGTGTECAGKNPSST